jgi:hypothetical protein
VVFVRRVNLGTRNPELGTRNSELGTRNPEPRNLDRLTLHPVDKPADFT